ncbi:MAG: DUF5654 family protein [Actinomycetota bacterium]|nr:DUF5654 family protein [Actinomycetota bacterium]
MKAVKAEEALTGEILDKFSQLITTALGLVAALAWNDAIQTIFQQFLGSAGGALAAKIFYAVLVTIIVVMVLIHKYQSPLRVPPSWSCVPLRPTPR